MIKRSGTVWTSASLRTLDRTFEDTGDQAAACIGSAPDDTTDARQMGVGTSTRRHQLAIGLDCAKLGICKKKMPRG